MVPPRNLWATGGGQDVWKWSGEKSGVVTHLHIQHAYTPLEKVVSSPCACRVSSLKAHFIRIPIGLHYDELRSYSNSSD